MLDHKVAQVDLGLQRHGAVRVDRTPHRKAECHDQDRARRPQDLATQEPGQEKQQAERGRPEHTPHVDEQAGRHAKCAGQQPRTAATNGCCQQGR